MLSGAEERSLEGLYIALVAPSTGSANQTGNAARAVELRGYEAASDETWHNRLGHASYDKVKKMIHSDKSGISRKGTPNEIMRTACVESKKKQGPASSKAGPEFL